MMRTVAALWLRARPLATSTHPRLAFTPSARRRCVTQGADLPPEQPLKVAWRDRFYVADNVWGRDMFAVFIAVLGTSAVVYLAKHHTENAPVRDLVTEHMEVHSSKLLDSSLQRSRPAL